jgi:hypothetical protein
MKPTQQDPQDDELDRMLRTHMNASNEQLTPSSGFTQSVMDVIREETTAPPPIPFPWKRLLPAAIALLCAMIGLGVFAGRHTPALPQGLSRDSFNFAISSATATNLLWIALAIGLSLFAATVSFKLAAGRR